MEPGTVVVYVIHGSQNGFNIGRKVRGLPRNRRVNPIYLYIYLPIYLSSSLCVFTRSLDANPQHWKEGSGPAPEPETVGAR